MDIVLLFSLRSIYPLGSNKYCILIDTIIIDRELIFYLQTEEYRIVLKNWDTRSFGTRPKFLKIIIFDDPNIWDILKFSSEICNFCFQRIGTRLSAPPKNLLVDVRSRKR